MHCCVLFVGWLGVCEAWFAFAFDRFVWWGLLGPLLIAFVLLLCFLYDRRYAGVVYLGLSVLVWVNGMVVWVHLLDLWACGFVVC